MPEWKQEIRQRLTSLMLEPTREAAIIEELAQHLEDRYRELISGGAEPEVARREVLAELNDGELLAKELDHAPKMNGGRIAAGSSGGRLFSDLWQDLRYGTRMLRKSPGYAAIMVLTLALGIGANTTVFSVVDAVLFRPLPYKESEQLVDVLASKIGAESTSKLFDSYSDFLEWKSHSTSFDELAACTWARPARNLTWQGKTQRVLGIPATNGFFSLLGVRAAQGRTFEPRDLGTGDMVVLSHHFWQSRLGGAPDIVGAGVILEERTCTVFA